MKTPGFRFERIQVWQKAMAWVRSVYQCTGSFPENERFGITAQLRRAAVSVPSNIAEGSSRRSNTEFARFLEVAYGSLLKAVCQSRLASDLGFMIGSDFKHICREAEEIAGMLSGLRSYLMRNKKTQVGEVATDYYILRSALDSKLPSLRSTGE